MRSILQAPSILARAIITLLTTIKHTELFTTPLQAPPVLQGRRILVVGLGCEASLLVAGGRHLLRRPRPPPLGRPRLRHRHGLRRRSVHFQLLVYFELFVYFLTLPAGGPTSSSISPKSESSVSAKACAIVEDAPSSSSIGSTPRNLPPDGTSFSQGRESMRFPSVLRALQGIPSGLEPEIQQAF